MSRSEKQQNFLDQYPDLSDEDSNQNQAQRQEIENLGQPSKKIKSNEIGNPQKEAPKGPTIFKAPTLFGGRIFIPPPPPPPEKKVYTPSVSEHPSHQYHKAPPPKQYLKPTDNPNPNKDRQRKNCVFVKNIPKHYNDNQKLMTFFKNQGPIKQIRVNLQESSAMVRFVKEQHAAKFVNSGKGIFNRSFITYSLNEKDQVPAELIKQRQNEQSGKLKKPVEIEIKQLRERMENVLADKFRALSFLVRYIDKKQILQNLNLQIVKCKELKSALPKMTFEECNNLSKTLINDYDWTLVFQITSDKQIDKKTLFFDYQKKYGPVSNIDLKLLNNQITELEANEYQYIVKLTFLGVKHSWEFYSSRAIQTSKQPTENETNDKIEIQVEGSNMRILFNEGIIKLHRGKKQNEQQLPAESPSLEQKAE